MDKGVFIGILSKNPRTSFRYTTYYKIIYQSSSRACVGRHAMDLEDGVTTQRAPTKTSNYFLDNHYKTTNVNLSRGKDGSWSLWVSLARNKLKRRYCVQLIYKENSFFKRSTSSWLSFWHSLPWCRPCNLHELPQWLHDAKQSYPVREQAISGMKGTNDQMACTNSALLKLKPKCHAIKCHCHAIKK